MVLKKLEQSFLRGTKAAAAYRFTVYLIIAALVLAMGTFTNSGAASASERTPGTVEFIIGGKTIVINGKTRTLNNPVPVVNGTTMIPISWVSELLVGAKTYRDAEGYHLDTYLNKVRVNDKMRGSKRNGKYIVMASAALLIQNEMHVPLSAVQPLWDGSFKFDPALKKISLTIPPEPNAAPVAQFNAPDIVKRGEPIPYISMSYDPDGKIVKEEWTNNKRVYFEAGIYNATLKVTDNEGLVSEYTRTITVTSETLYNPMDYHLRFGYLGDKFPISNAQTAQYPLIYGQVEALDTTLILSNGPEKFEKTGILYQDLAIGRNRVFYHHRNGSDKSLRFAVVIRNLDDSPARVNIGGTGVAGPSDSVLAVGRVAVQRYLGSTRDLSIVLQPNEAYYLSPEFANTVVAPGSVVSGIIDFHALRKVQVTTLVCEEIDNPPDMAAFLQPLDRAGNRGTFKKADKRVYISEPLGIEPKQIRLGHLGSSIQGVDVVSGVQTTNFGEYGSITELKLYDVAYGTTVLLNPRAGNFAGALSFNGISLEAPKGGFVKSDEAVLVYRHLPPKANDGSYNKELTIRYTSPGGSFLPVILAFLPPAVN